MLRRHRSGARASSSNPGPCRSSRHSRLHKEQGSAGPDLEHSRQESAWPGEPPQPEHCRRPARRPRHQLRQPRAQVADEAGQLLLPGLALALPGHRDLQRGPRLCHYAACGVAIAPRRPAAHVTSRRNPARRARLAGQELLRCDIQLGAGGSEPMCNARQRSRVGAHAHRQRRAALQLVHQDSLQAAAARRRRCQPRLLQLHRVGDLRHHLDHGQYQGHYIRAASPTLPLSCCCETA